MGFPSLKDLRARSAARAGVTAQVKSALVSALALSEADAVSVNEIACPDFGCPDVETVVLVMRAGEPTVALKIRKALDAIAAFDIEALRAEDHRRRSGD